MTNENAVINRVDAVIRAREGSLLAGVEPPVEVLVSNILAEILVQMIPDMQTVLAEQATVIFSGIIEEKKQLVADVLTQNGYTVTAQNQDGGWVVLVAERSA